MNSNPKSGTTLKIVLVISVIQSLIIAGLFFYIQYKNEQSGEAVNQINKDTITFNPDTFLKHFYEPTAKTNITHQNKWTGEKIINSINTDSLNERVDYSPEKPESVFRIITLGDSFTYGFMVNTAENYPEQLEDQLNSNKPCPGIDKYEVINLGVEGYDIEYSLKRFKERGQKYNPDLVIWLLKRGDFEQISELIYTDAEAITSSLQEKGELEGYKARGFYNPGYEIAVHELENKYGKEAIFNHQKEALASLNNYFKKDLVLLTFADLEAQFRDFLLDFQKSRQKTYLVNTLPKLSESEIFPDTHPNKDGYQRIASHLSSSLNERQLLGCF